MNRRDSIRGLFALAFSGNHLLQSSAKFVPALVAEKELAVDTVQLSKEDQLRALLNSAIIYAYGSNADYGRANFEQLWRSHYPERGNKPALKSIDTVLLQYGKDHDLK